MILFTLKNPDAIKLDIAMKGYTLRAFSREVGISSSFLSQIINDYRKASPKTALKIATGLNKEIEEIFFINFACCEQSKEG